MECCSDYRPSSGTSIVLLLLGKPHTMLTNELVALPSPINCQCRIDELLRLLRVKKNKLLIKFASRPQGIWGCIFFYSLEIQSLPHQCQKTGSKFVFVCDSDQKLSKTPNYCETNQTRGIWITSGGENSPNMMQNKTIFFVVVLLLFRSQCCYWQVILKRQCLCLLIRLDCVVLCTKVIFWQRRDREKVGFLVPFGKEAVWYQPANIISACLFHLSVNTARCLPRS